MFIGLHLNQFMHLVSLLFEFSPQPGKSDEAKAAEKHDDRCRFRDTIRFVIQSAHICAERAATTGSPVNQQPGVAAERYTRISGTKSDYGNSFFEGFEKNLRRRATRI